MRAKHVHSLGMVDQGGSRCLITFLIDTVTIVLLNHLTWHAVNDAGKRLISIVRCLGLVSIIQGAASYDLH